MSSYWMIVERYENWVVDRDEGFQRFGISQKKEMLAKQLETGDLLVVYISGLGCFSDLRRVRSASLVRLKYGGSYDSPFSSAIATEPTLTLPEEKWVRAASLAAKLTFLAKPDWRQSFRHSLRRLPEPDGKIIEGALRQAQRNPAKLAK